MYASTPTNPNACTDTIVTHTYTHTLTHSHMYIIFMHAYTSTHVLAYTYMHSQIHMPTHIYTHIYTYTYRHTHTRALSQFLSCCYSRTSDRNSLLKKNSLGRKGLLDLYFWVTAHHCGKSERKLKQRSRRNTAYGLILWLVLLAFLHRQAHLPKDGASHVNHVSRPCGW